MPPIIALALYFVMRLLNRQTLRPVAVVDTEVQLLQVGTRRAQNKPVEGLTFSSSQPTKGLWGRHLRRKEAERDKLLRQLAEAKQLLEKTKLKLAFLSVDIVGSTRMKLGEDHLLAERVFRECRYFLEQTFKKYRYRTASWTPDGVMVCFPRVDLACGAAKELLSKLRSFNKEENPLQIPILVRCCDLNAGEVYYHESTPLEMLCDPVLDVTGHLQKAAQPDRLLVTEEIYSQLHDKKGFVQNDSSVDGVKVLEWSAIYVASAP